MFSRSTGINAGFIDDPAGVRPPATVRLVFQELFKGAFRNRLRENFSLNSARNVEDPDLLHAATNDTRFLVRCMGIPEDVSAFVAVTGTALRTNPLAESGPSPRGVLVSPEWNSIGGSMMSLTASPIVFTHRMLLWA